MVFQDPYASLNPRWRVKTMRKKVFKTGDFYRENNKTTDPLFVEGFGIPNIEPLVQGRPAKTLKN